jgi:hypothetical protein
MGRVDLDGLWHWREIDTYPSPYEIGQKVTSPHPEVLKARESWHLPWHHFPGGEWLVANPVEIPGISELLKSCLNVNSAPGIAQPQSTLLSIPIELIEQILDFMNPADLNAVAKTCLKFYHLTQPRFRALLNNDMAWLWEIFEGSQYPESPDQPVAWDPLCPLGIPPPAFPVGLEKEEVEAEIWEQVIAEYPEMEDVGNAVKAVNSQRREEILAPYQEKLDFLIQKWTDFRAGVETWICEPQKDAAEVDWRRVWRLFNPATSLIPGMRNRARIWERCEEIMDYVARAHKLGEVDKKLPDLLAKLRDPSQPGWTTNPEVDGWD